MSFSSTIGIAPAASKIGERSAAGPPFVTLLKSKLALRLIDKSRDAHAHAQACAHSNVSPASPLQSGSSVRDLSIVERDALEQISRQPKPTEIRPTRFQHQANDVPSCRIHLQRYTRTPRTGGRRATFANQPLTQHRLGQHPHTIGRDSRSLVQIRTTQPALGPQNSKELSLTRFNHGDIIASKSGAT